MINAYFYTFTLFKTRRIYEKTDVYDLDLGNAFRGCCRL